MCLALINEIWTRRQQICCSLNKAYKDMRKHWCELRIVNIHIMTLGLRCLDDECRFKRPTEYIVCGFKILNTRPDESSIEQNIF